MADNLSDYLGTTALAVGALGAASYGIVDGLKLFAWIDLAGFERLFSGTGGSGGRRWPATSRVGLDPLLPPLALAYGDDVMELLKAQYRSSRAKGDLPRTLRQGVRIGFGTMEPGQIADCVMGLGLPRGTADLAAEAIHRARMLRPPASGEEERLPATGEPTVSEEGRSALARLETTIDARIDAALALAEIEYVTQTKVLAMVVSLAIAFGVGLYLGRSVVECFAVGIAAVPLAPVAKDLSTALQAAVKAFKGK